MASISDLNIVIQQGGKVQEVQNPRQGQLDPNHVIAHHQIKKVDKKKKTVKQSQDADQVQPDAENPQKSKHRKQSSSRAKMAKGKNALAKRRGRLIDTVV
ncbi:MAG: hypothetical protein QNI92_08070 [Desulfobacterales bacterium]|nr:hypothetical protein [Desulfobacterales bacterium]MDJ0914001.1 hypothetical protein [Desulfobacterales bacterium]